MSLVWDDIWLIDCLVTPQVHRDGCVYWSDADDSGALQHGYNFFQIESKIKDIAHLKRFYAIYPAGYAGRAGLNDQVRAINCVEHRPDRKVAVWPSLVWVNAERERPPYDTEGLTFMEHRTAAEPPGLPMFVTPASYFYQALVDFGRTTALGDRVSVAQMAGVCCAATPGNTFSFASPSPCMSDADHKDMLRLYGRVFTAWNKTHCVSDSTHLCDIRRSDHVLRVTTFWCEVRCVPYYTGAAERDRTKRATSLTRSAALGRMLPWLPTYQMSPGLPKRISTEFSRF